MATIVHYTDTHPAHNGYPTRIISPTRSRPCCFSDMEAVGEVQQEGRWVYQYTRCQTCGYAVRVIVREIPDAALIADLRRILEASFQRNIPDY
jgi:hypothetical protein